MLGDVMHMLYSVATITIIEKEKKLSAGYFSYHQQYPLHLYYVVGKPWRFNLKLVILAFITKFICTDISGKDTLHPDFKFGCLSSPKLFYDIPLISNKSFHYLKWPSQMLFTLWDSTNTFLPFSHFESLFLLVNYYSFYVN